MPDIDPEILKFQRRVMRAAVGGIGLSVHGGGGFEKQIEGDFWVRGLVGTGGSWRFKIYSWCIASAWDDDSVLFKLKTIDGKHEVMRYDAEKVRKYTPLLYKFAPLDELADV